MEKRFAQAVSDYYLYC